jgi:hypothetical protein
VLSPADGNSSFRSSSRRSWPMILFSACMHLGKGAETVYDLCGLRFLINQRTVFSCASP